MPEVKTQPLLSSLVEHSRSLMQGGMAGLPMRVRRLVHQHESEGERLIGWAQLALVITFAVLYSIARRPADASMGVITPVPIALAMYGAFTIARLYLSYRIRLPGWLVVVSILLDTGLLIGLIWYFHFDYAQPAAFSLKIPTFIYIFVFIGLRALNFDPRYVLLAGVVAALSWIGLVVLVVNDVPDSSITRSFVEYMTGNRILIGAEVEKVVTLLLVAGLLALAVARARRMLVLSVQQETAAKEIGRFLSRGLTDVITKADEEVKPGQASERRAAIMMLDIRGFTRFAAGVDPRELVAMLTGLHGRLLPLIHANNGVVDKYLGDGIMATFGAIQPSERPCAEALSALEAIMREAEAWSAELKAKALATPLTVNGAVASGDVVFATLGDADRLEYTVIGEAVNLAAKLEKHNKAEGTRALVTLSTYEEALAQGFTPAKSHARLKSRIVAGAPNPVDLVVLA
jgi:adenylate cyclase